MSGVRDLAARIRPPRRSAAATVTAHLDRLTKPVGSLGELERVAIRLAAIYGDPPPPLRGRVVFVLAGDHGVARRGVSAYPQAVTAQMCRNYAGGGAAVNVLARAVGARVVVADLGVDADLADLAGILHHKVRRGTRDFVVEPALTSEETERAVAIGAALLDRCDPAPDIVALGEMGIGNTTAAAALTAALTGAPLRDVVGPGTGLRGDALAYKRRVVAQALERVGAVDDPLDLLRQLGGLEIAGLVGLTLRAASRQRAVVLDGFIATVAALVAIRLAPAAGAFCFAGHRSTEPGHRVLLRALNLRPLLDLDLRLGEGTGAVLALPILESAGALLREMATFTSAGVSTRLAAKP